MPSTTTNGTRSQPTPKAEEPNKKRYKAETISSVARVNNRKHSTRSATKRASNKKIETRDTTKKRKRRVKTPTKKDPEPLVNAWYFNAAQQPNSLPEWIDDDVRVLTPRQIRRAIEKYCVGWSDEALIKEREERRKKLWK